MSDLENAKKILTEENCTFAACRGDETLTSTGRGVSPLLELLDSGKNLRGWSVADRVIGRAAAFLYVLLGAEKIHAGVMSRPALEVFRRFRMDAVCDKTTDLILNRTCTGLCPMESAVLAISDPAEAEQAIRRKLRELRGLEREHPDMP